MSIDLIKDIYTLFVLVVIMPANGIIAFKVNLFLGLLLITMQVPLIVSLIFGK